MRVCVVWRRQSDEFQLPPAAAGIVLPLAVQQEATAHVDIVARALLQQKPQLRQPDAVMCEQAVDGHLGPLVRFLLHMWRDDGEEVEASTASYLTAVVLVQRSEGRHRVGRRAGL